MSWRKTERAGCRLRRSPGLAVGTARSLPAAIPGVSNATDESCESSDLPQWPANFSCAALTGPTLLCVSRQLPERLPPYSRAAATAFLVTLAGPQDRLPEHEVRGECGLRKSAAGLRWTRKLRRLRSRQNRDARAAVGAHLDAERRLENLFEQFALVNSRGRAHAQAAAALH